MELYGSFGEVKSSAVFLREERFPMGTGAKVMDITCVLCQHRCGCLVLNALVLSLSLSRSPLPTHTRRHDNSSRSWNAAVISARTTPSQGLGYPAWFQEDSIEANSTQKSGSAQHENVARSYVNTCVCARRSSAVARRSLGRGCACREEGARVARGSQRPPYLPRLSGGTAEPCRELLSRRYCVR